MFFPGPARPCISAEQYEALEKTLKENYLLLGLDQKAISAMTTKFAWPLRQANGLNDCSYFTLRNFVDQDTTPDSIRDWTVVVTNTIEKVICASVTVVKPREEGQPTYCAIKIKKISEEIPVITSGITKGAVTRPENNVRPRRPATAQRARARAAGSTRCRARCIQA